MDNIRAQIIADVGSPSRQMTFKENVMSNRAALSLAFRLVDASCRGGQELQQFISARQRSADKRIRFSTSGKHHDFHSVQL